VEGSVIRVVLLKKREARGERVEKGLMGVKEIEKKRRRERGGMIKRRGFQSRSFFWGVGSACHVGEEEEE
jgi:hypothetical protein